MSDNITRHMMEPYIESFGAPMFLASQFRARTFTSERVEVDIQRSSGDVAVVVKDIASGARMNTLGTFSNKEMVPAIIKEAFNLSAFDLMDRQPGQPSQFDPSYGANLNAKAIAGASKVADKARRTVELMCSQVLQTGTVTLVDSAGSTMYTIDFDPKSAHFPTVSNSWGGGSATPIADLSSLCAVIRKNGRRRPRRAIFGATAWAAFISDSTVTGALDTRRLDLGLIQASSISDAGTYWGDLNVGNAVLECWTYDGDYADPQTGTVTPYVGADNVIIIAEGARLDLCYGALPYVAPPDPRVMQYLPTRVSGAGFDLTVNGYIANNNQALTIELGTRPIAVPTAIDTFGCLDTTA